MYFAVFVGSVVPSRPCFVRSFLSFTSTLTLQRRSEGRLSLRARAHRRAVESMSAQNSDFRYNNLHDARGLKSGDLAPLDFGKRDARARAVASSKPAASRRTPPPTHRRMLQQRTKTMFLRRPPFPTSMRTCCSKSSSTSMTRSDLPLPPSPHSLAIRAHSRGCARRPTACEAAATARDASATAWTRRSTASQLQAASRGPNAA